jgi:tetratricopeptide (TPR) repeat protein
MKIDAEKGEGIELARKFGVRGFPTILLVSPAGDEIDRLVGYLPPQPFIKAVQGYLNGENTMAALKKAADTHPNDPAAVFALAGKYSERMDLSNAADRYMQYLVLDPKDSLGHRVDAMFAIALASTRIKNEPSALKNFVEQYPQAPQTRQGLAMLMDLYIRQKNAEEARHAFESYIKLSPDDAQMMNNYAWECAKMQINQEHAEKIAAEAVALAKDDKERAMYLDTQAATAFALGKQGEAVRLEENAIGLMKNATPKELEEYTKALDLYKNGKKETTK